MLRRSLLYKLSSTLIILFLFLFSFFYSLSYFHQHETLPDFSHQNFVPSVLFACGRGFVGIPFDRVEKLGNFLNSNKGAFSCRDLPNNLRPYFAEPSAYIQRYLMMAIALIWKYFGVSWEKLIYLYGTLVAVAMTCAYGIFRLGMSRILSVLLVLLMLKIGTQIHYANHLREYFIVPFLYAFILLLGFLVKRKHKKTIFFVDSFLIGLVLGIGAGIRVDILIYLPVFLLTLFFFVPKGYHFNEKCIAFVLFFVPFYASVFPIFLAFGKGANNMFHVALIGLSDPVNQNLNIANSPLYRLFLNSSDSYITASVISLAQRFYPAAIDAIYESVAYSHMSFLYLREIFKYFPADLLLRGYASMIIILQMFYAYIVNILSYHLQHFPFQAFLYVSTFSVNALSLMFLRAINLRLFSFLVLFLFFLLTYPAIQFELRHYFYLEIISFWLFGFTLHQLILLCRRIFWKSSFVIDKSLIMDFKKSAVFLACFLLVLSLPLMGLRWYQQKHLESYFTQYLKLKKRPLLASYVKFDSQVLVILPSFEQGNLGQASKHDFYNGSVWYAKVNTGYLVVDFDSRLCQTTSFDLSTRYKLQDWIKEENLLEGNQLAVHIPIRLDNLARIFIPVYSDTIVKFSGLEMPFKALSCLKGIYAIEDVKKFPLLLDLQFVPGWEKLPLYQKIK